MPVINPAASSIPKKYASLEELFQKEDMLEGDEGVRMSAAQITEEARMRRLLIDAGQPGGALADAPLQESMDDVDEPHPGFAPSDYMSKHAVDLLGRIQREAREHRALAKRIGMQAAAEAYKRMPKSEEELDLERRAVYVDGFRRYCVRELRSYFDSVVASIWQQKKLDYEQQEAAAGRDRMMRMVDRSEGLLSGRTGRRALNPDDADSSMLDTDLDDEEGVSASELDDDDDDEDNEEDDDTDSSEDESDEHPDSDNELSAEQLMRKYSDLPDLPDESGADSEGEDEESDAEVGLEADDETNDFDDDTSLMNTQDAPHVVDPSQHALEEVDDALLDDSEESSDSGTPQSSSDEEASDDEEEASSGGDGSDDEAQDPLMGFFSKSDRQRFEVKPEPSEAAEEDAPDTPPRPTPTPNDREPADLVNGYHSRDVDTKMEEATSSPVNGEPNGHSTPEEKLDSQPQDDDVHMKDEPDESIGRVSATLKRRDADALALLHNHAEAEEAERISVSPLIRGNLRPYQHAGFDWLARMYNESTNGILADEMGLGKTFQTIALLAHLATHHQIWGPHLVVVPTSVMLNWELEFKKFCPGFKILTYYGTQEERRQKRKGWMNKDKWHVCITSYQLALQDAQPLKRRDWHYLILDEAHNIKNFRSQRWQTLLSFKSEARLLLTGTPLQNNLSELWSLLFFLAPEENSGEGTGFGSLQEFSKVFHKPVDQILEHGRGVLDEESLNIMTKLHKVLRPHLLRRLKADVEKQMPKKYEHVTVCRLSKRQRQLYDSYVSLAGTRDSFASGNYMSIINCLMQLRKVCNHPDLFDTRQIVTSYAMPKSAIAEFEIKDLLIRRRLLRDDEASRSAGISLWGTNEYSRASASSRKLSAAPLIESMAHKVASAVSQDKASLHSVESSLAEVDRIYRKARSEALMLQAEKTSERCRRRPLFDRGLMELILNKRRRPKPEPPHVRGEKSDLVAMTAEPFLASLIEDMKLSTFARSEAVRPIVKRFGCVTPAVVAPGMTRLALRDAGTEMIQKLNKLDLPDPYHEARLRLSIAFPDKSLIQYDCGKLQALDKLLRRLQTNGHRALIFTQMTKVLDILEQFMNLHGHRYLRLDGATKIEQRQVLTDRFNNDPRILCFILSSRSGGLGINLTGADTVIFYDLDWNPAMDKQCQDRCHRIGQTRDVHIYRFVSEGTIEANILRKSNQKRMLDDAIIQEGDFTTEFLDKMGASADDTEGNAEASAALDKILGGSGGATTTNRSLGQAEDKEDQEAAAVAQKEDVQPDDAADFDERPSAAAPADASAALTRYPPASPSSATPQTPMSDSQPAGDASSTAGTVSDAPPRPAPSHVTPEERTRLVEAFAAQPLAQDKPVLRWTPDEDGTLGLPSFSHYVLRLFEWELRDARWAPPKEPKKKGKRAGKGGEWGRIRR